MGSLETFDPDKTRQFLLATKFFSEHKYFDLKQFSGLDITCELALFVKEIEENYDACK